MAEIEIPDPKEVHEKAENPFTRRIALFVAIFAVGLAFASFGAGNVTKELILLKQDQARIESESRQEEFNKWSQFQSKSTREALYKNQSSILEMEKAELNEKFPEFKVKLLKQFTEDTERMKKDKDDLAAEAKAINQKGKADSDKVQEEYKIVTRKDPYFDFAEVMFQLAIVLASVAMLSEKKWPFYLSLILGILAAFLTINGFFLFTKIPFVESIH